MKCEECLYVIEEYIDGELGSDVESRVGAHLSACASCAAAHEALRAEQEIYLRYDRGLEVTPALWQRVSAEIARAAPAGEEHAPRESSPLARLRGLLFTGFAALALRPAYASSLALVVLCAAVGALWLSNSLGGGVGPAGPDEMAGRQAPVTQPSRAEQDEPVVAAATRELQRVENGGAVQELSAPKRRDAGVLVATTGARAGAGGVRPAVSPAAADSELAPPDPDHLAEAAGVSVIESGYGDSEDDPIADAARLLDPEEKEVARHVERAQMLLRSFKNARAAGGAPAVNVAYEKELSRRLLAENVTLQLGAEAAGDKRTRRVLDTIQPYLLDIANMRDNPSREEVRSVRERMRRTEIIAALQVY